MDIEPVVEQFALHLKNTCTDKEIHDLVGSIYPDEEAMQAWKLTPEQYYDAIHIVCFAPQEIKIIVH